MTDKFIDSPLGSSWRASIIEGINFCSLGIEGYRKRKATKFDNSILPEWMQAVEDFIDSLPFAVSIHDMADFFYVEEDLEKIALGELAKGELETTLVQLENLPTIYFEDQTPPPPPTPDPSISICERLVTALEGIKTLTAAEVRLILKEELAPLFGQVLQQGHYTRVELAEARAETEIITNAVIFNADRDRPVFITDKIWEKINQEQENPDTEKIQQIWNALHEPGSTAEAPKSILGNLDFPLTLPKSLISKFSQGTAITPETVQIKNYLELIEWLFRIFEELIGEFPLGLEIITDKKEKPIVDENGNPILDEEGNPQTEVEIQKEVVRLPNISECLAEVYLLNHQSYLNSEVNLELMVKQISSLVVCQKVAIQNAYKLQALEDYLGCDFEIEVVDMPMPFTVGAQSISAIKKPKTTKIEVAKYNQKRNFQDALAQLLHSAGVIKSLFWRSLPKDAESAASAFKGIIENQKATRDIIEKLDQDNLDIDLEKIEQGFTSEAGISDSTPYGLPLEQRPRIKQIGRQDAEGQ